MTSNKPASINEYIAGFPKETQEILEQVRVTIKKAVPEAEEMISYAMPAFNFKGRYLVYFAGYKNHISLYPAPRQNEAFKQALSAYKGGVGTVQFPLNKPVPFELIARIAKFRVKEIVEKGAPLSINLTNTNPTTRHTFSTFKLHYSHPIHIILPLLDALVVLVYVRRLRRTVNYE